MVVGPGGRSCFAAVGGLVRGGGARLDGGSGL